MLMALRIWAEWVTKKSEVERPTKIQPHLHLFVGGAIYEIHFLTFK